MKFDLVNSFNPDNELVTQIILIKFEFLNFRYRIHRYNRNFNRYYLKKQKKEYIYLRSRQKHLFRLSTAPLSIALSSN